MIRGLRYLFWRGKPPKEMDYTHVIRLAPRLKSELADEARRRFLRPSAAKTKPAQFAPCRRQGANWAGHFQKRNGGSRFAFESCAARTYNGALRSKATYNFNLRMSLLF